MYNQQLMAQYYQIIEDSAPGKFTGACIYSISINNKIIYIGKSTDTKHRIASHMLNIDYPESESYNSHKYQIMREAKQQGYKLKFDVMYKSQETDPQKIEEDIGKQEGVLIRQYLPPLNYQIPKEEDWHKFKVNKQATRITLEQLLALLQ